MISFFEQYVASLRMRDDSDPEDVKFWWKASQTEWALDALQVQEGWQSVDIENLSLAIPDPIRTALAMGICWMAGGFVRRWLAGEDMYAADIDLFFPTVEAKAETVDLLQAAGFQIYFVCPEGKLTSLKREYEDGARPTIVQCVSQDYYSGPMECIYSFDFTVSMFALTSTYLYMGERSLRDLSSKVLQLNSLPFPAATMRRMMKYQKDGYWLSEECAIDFLSAVRTDALGRFLESGAQDAFASVGGSFEDDRPAGVREDFNRWYID